MKRLLPITLALAAGLGASASAQTTKANYSQGTPVVVIGKISSQPRDVGFTHEEKMQVAVGPEKTDYTLHLADAGLYGFHGNTVSADDLQDKLWVRAEGVVMDDPRRIKVHRLQIIGGETNDIRHTAFHRAGFDRGYVMATGQPATTAWSEGTPVVVVGPITSPPKGALNEKKMQVAIGPRREDYTLHFSDAEVIGRFGQKLDEDGLDDRMWVRAEGRVMDDPRRIKVSRVQVIGRDTQEALASGFLSGSGNAGFVSRMSDSRVAGSRQAFRPGGTTFVAAPFTIVGKVSDDTGTFETTRAIQVQAAGNEWTLDVTDDANVMDAKGEKISVHEVDEGQWVRATGWPTDDRRMRVVRIENLGPEAAFRASSFYRSTAPMGYVERVAGERGEFRATNLRGQVVAVGERANMLVIRDDGGRYHHVYTDNAEIRFRNRDGALRDVRVGDMVTVTGRTVLFP